VKIRIEKLGNVFKPTGEFPWSRSHAQVPFPVQLNEKVIRVFFATRDEQSRSSVSFVDVDATDPTKVLRVHDAPCLSHGEKQACFDDSGTMPSWFIADKEKITLYYTAWNKSDSASYRLSIGVADSNDNGLTFTRRFEGPVMDRGTHDPIWVGQPCVLNENGKWKMWYLSCEKIERIHGHPEPFYNVKYAESTDGVSWKRDNIICIPFDTTTDAIGRPFVFRRDGKYFMLHSNRKADGYRTQKDAGYRLELSQSGDGLAWSKVENFRFEKSDEGWDSIMNEYSALIPCDENSYWLFYNGNGFGATGFGLARLIFE
jgi:predicted GH43/DUF377 family glycosyl hydrolase